MKKRFISRFLALLLAFLLAFPGVSVSAQTNNNNLLPPSNLSFQLITPSDVRLSWSSVYGAAGYNVYGIMDGQLLLLGTTTSTSYTFNDLPEGSYSYVMSTLSVDGESGPCAPVTVDIVYPNMSAPATLGSKLQNGNDIVLTWTASQYAQNYNLYKINSDGQKTLVAAPKTSTYTITNAAAGSHTYAVTAAHSLYSESPLSASTQLEVVFPIMTAPANFTSSLLNGNDVNLKWNGVSFATAYKVYQIIDGEKVLRSTVTGTSVTYTNMAAGNYLYEVRSFSDRFGESQDGSQTSLTLTLPTMQAPSNFTHSIANGNDVTLKWNPVSFATNYRIYEIINGEKVLKSTVTGTSITYSRIAAGSYAFEVRSYSDRFGESQEGSQTSFTLVFPVMQAPANLTNSIANGNDITLRWDSVPFATNYKVYQITNGLKVLKSTITGTTVTYTNMPGGDYSYEVYSFSDRFGESQNGSSIMLTLVLPVMQPPANVVQVIKSSTEFALNWEAAANATNYRVYQIVNGQKVLKSTISGTTVTYSNMSPGEYNFVIHSYSNRFGESASGSSITVTLNGQTMQPPTNLTYTIANGNDITLRWTAAPYATSYKIYQLIDGQPVLQRSVTSTSTVFTNLPGGDYNFIVNSVSSLLGESPNGAEISFTLVLPQMTAPNNLTQKIQNGNDVVLTWSAVTHANNYKVYELVDEQPVLRTTVSSTSATLTNVEEGSHTYVVTSVSNRFGESEGSQVSLSIVFPTMAAPDNFTYTLPNGNDIALKWNPVSFATSYKVYEIVNNQKVLKQTITGTNVTFTNMPEGNYKYEVYSFSSRFGESPEGSQLSFTLVFPIMQAPANLTNSIANGNDITLKWNSASYATSYKIYEITNGQKVLKQTVTSTSVTFINMPEGDYKYEVHSFSSRFGESPAYSTTSFKLVWPIVQPPVLAGTIQNVNNITLSWQTVTWANEYRVYEITNGIKQLLYKGTALNYKIFNLSEGTHSYQMTAFSNRFGESAVSNTITENIVYPIMQPPVATLKLTSQTSAQISWSFVTYANSYNIYEIIDNTPVVVAKNINNLSYTINNLTYADHEYYVTSFSNSFGESARSNIVLAKLIIDTTPPVTTADAPANWINQSPITVTLSSTDNLTGVADTYYSINEGTFIKGTSFTITEEGINKVSFYSVDKVGNTEAVQTIYIKIDKTAPVTIASDSTNWKNSFAWIELLSMDPLSGIDEVYHSINGSDWKTGVSFPIIDEGINILSFYAIDKAGNIESIKTFEAKIDKTAPVTTSNAPTNWSKDDVTIELTATDVLSGVAKTFYSINDSDYLEGTSFTVNKEGINKVSFYSVDLAGNIEIAKTVEVKIDKTAPVTTSNAVTSWTKDNVTIELTANDILSGADKTFYSVDGAEYLEGTSFVISSEGTHSVSFYSVDAAGNTESANTVDVKIDKTAPVTIFDKSVNSSKNEITVKLTAIDELSGVAKTYYSINGSDYLEGNIFIVKDEGTYKISFYSVDIAGNIESANTDEIIINNISPSVVMNLNPEYALGSTLKLLYVVKEDHLGIANEKMLVYGPNDNTGKAVTNGSSIKLDKPGVYTVVVTVTGTNGLSTTIEKKFTVYISANIEVTPKVIKGNNGVFTVRVDLPSGYNTQGFDLNTVTLNGVNALNSNNGYYNQAKLGQFKFERSDFNWSTPEVTIEFRGYVNGYLVVGKTTVKVQK